MYVISIIHKTDFYISIISINNMNLVGQLSISVVGYVYIFHMEFVIPENMCMPNT